MDVEEFIQHSNKVDSVDTLFDLYAQAMKKFGYDRLLFALLTDHPHLNREAKHGVLSSYPQDWVSYYLDQGYDAVDPVRTQCRQKLDVFSWADLQKQMRLNKKQIRMFNEAEEAELCCGIGIPLRGPAGSSAAIGAASSTQLADNDAISLDKINLITYQFYTCFSRLEQQIALKKNIPRLTGQELEILKWSANGLSRCDIAETLKISAHTVDFHIRNLFRKLNVVNITHAVATAISLDLIQF